MIESMVNNKKFYILIFLCISFSALAQDADTTKTVISTDSQTHTVNKDSLSNEEFSPLDIASDRGLFILTNM